MITHYPAIIWTRSKQYRKEDERLFSSANVIYLPTTYVYTHKQQCQQFYEDIYNLNASDIVFVSSPFVVADMCKHILANQAKNIKVACFGTTSTTLLSDHGFQVLSVNNPEIHTSYKLALYISDKLREQKKTHATVYYPKALITAHDIEGVFCKKGIAVKIYTLYENRFLTHHNICQKGYKKIISLNDHNIITTFASPSAFLAYKKLGLSLGYKQVVIGKTTEACLIQHGLQPRCSPEASCASLAQTAMLMAQGK
ncbi:MAG: uroporphyrinogen-III synthase [Proteobacteria bacterium]|nr:uroporphyrinogen-III synthase [Pseudomonadota bacterium]